MKTKLIHFLILCVVGFTTFYLDFLTKNNVLEYFSDKETYFLEITPYFNIILAYNRGVSFGMLNDTTYSQWFFIAMSCSLVFLMLCWFLASKDLRTVIPLALIIGGAIGNILDRFTHGAVVDFLDFHIGLWHYPAFNIADAAICVGVFILIFFATPKTTEIGKFA